MNHTDDPISGSGWRWGLGVHIGLTPPTVR